MLYTVKETSFINVGIGDAMGYYPRLKDLREDKDLTIRELASQLHMQKTTYHNYETGKRELPFELAVTLAKFYNVSLDYIGGITNDPTPPNKKSIR